MFILVLAVLFATVWVMSGSTASADHSATMTFLNISHSHARSYTESGITVTNKFHLHIHGGTLFHHSLGAHVFKHVGGQKFTLVQMKVVNARGASKFTSSSGASVSVPIKKGTFVFPPGFSCITSASWTMGRRSRWNIDNIVIAPCEIKVDLDIKPGSNTNPINPRSNGVVPVAILGSKSFNVKDVDRSSLAFGPSGANPAHKALGHLEDVNGDGRLDLVSHYRAKASGIAKGDTSACVTGKTTTGTPIGGCDSVRTVGK